MRLLNFRLDRKSAVALRELKRRTKLKNTSALVRQCIINELGRVVGRSGDGDAPKGGAGEGSAPLVEERRQTK